MFVVMPAVIVRQRKPYRRKDGTILYFEGNLASYTKLKVFQYDVYNCFWTSRLLNCITILFLLYVFLVINFFLNFNFIDTFR